MGEYKVSHLDDLDYFAYKETLTGRVRHELGISAFGVNSWLGPNVGDRVIPEHAEDQEGDQDELYVVVRGRARFEVNDDTFDAPEGTLVHVPAGPNRRTAFAEEAGTTVLAVGATAGKAFEVHGWEFWGPVHDLFFGGNYEGVITKGREAIEANPQYGMPLYNLACAESLGGHPQDAIEHLRMAIAASELFCGLARDDSDFDAIRDDPAFAELVASDRTGNGAGITTKDEAERTGDSEADSPGAARGRDAEGVGYTVSSIDEIEPIHYRQETRMRPVRQHLGIIAFGTNAWTAANVGDRLMPEHQEDEGNEELYVVVRGRARFEVDGESVDAPTGTLVFVRPEGNRTAFGEAAGTTVLALGSTVGQPYHRGGWEVWAPFHPLYEAGDYEAAIERSREVEEASEYAAPLYNLACCEALAGRPQDAIEHLRLAFERRPSLRDLAKEDSDLDPLRDEPAFRELVASAPAVRSS